MICALRRRACSTRLSLLPQVLRRIVAAGHLREADVDHAALKAVGGPPVLFS